MEPDRVGELPRRVALVVGGAGGIGAATAEWFGAAGWHVAVADVNEAGAAAVAARVEDRGGEAAAFATDVRSSGSVDAAVALVSRTFGRIDAVAACAGVIAPGPTATTDDAEWGHLIDVHLSGTFRCARSSVELLAASRGTFVAVSSVAGRLGMYQRASYCAAKAGIEGLVRSLAVEWAQHGIRVNAVAPGYIETDLVASALEGGAITRSELEKRTPLSRLGQPEEVAEAIGFLASHQSSYITGVVLAVDGGFVIDAGI
jgi:NAD(P)-dependent dehydrogenase (short-subunit alcohol dehydrogenase family)